MYTEKVMDHFMPVSYTHLDVYKRQVADELMAFADELEKADDFETALSKLIRRELAAHKRILFNGNGYSCLLYTSSCPHV